MHESSSCRQIHPLQFITYGWGLLHHPIIHCHDLIHQAIFKQHLHQYKIYSLDHIQLWISGMPWEATFFSIKNNVTQCFLWGTNGPMILSSRIAMFQPLLVYCHQFFKLKCCVWVIINPGVALTKSEAKFQLNFRTLFNELRINQNDSAKPLWWVVSDRLQTLQDSDLCTIFIIELD